MDIGYDISISVNGSRLSPMELRALIAVQSAGSQNKAAEELGIAVPVLHNYIKKAERKLGIALIDATQLSTRLTPEGREIVQQYQRTTRLFEERELSVGCTPVSRLFIDHIPEPVTLVQTDNLRLIELFELGLLDAVMLDDPQYAFDYRWEATEFHVGWDSLLHVRRGKKYARLKYGAQRLGFSHLDAEGKGYMVMGEAEEPEELLSSGYSYFVNASLASARELRVKPSGSTPELQHEIIGLRNDRPGISIIVDEMLGD